MLARTRHILRREQDPIRETLNRLAADGLVELSRNKGTGGQLLPADIGGLYDVRADFEPHAVLLSIPDLTDGDVDVLASFSARMEAGVAAVSDRSGWAR